jgi:hypothetical protein
MASRIGFLAFIALIVSSAFVWHAAEHWDKADFESIAVGVECPAYMAIDRDEAGLTVAVEIASPPGATAAPMVTLGVSATKTRVLGPKQAARKGSDGRWLAAFTIPSAQVAAPEADWAGLRIAVGAEFAGGPYGQPFYRARYRHRDGRALHAPFSHNPQDWLPFDLAAYAQRVADRGARTEIAFDQPLDGKATIVIEDADGRRVRNLIGGQPYLSGAHRIEWDLMNDEGAPVAPGVYRWRSLHHAGIDPQHLFSYCNDGNPPWKTGSGTDMWGPDHSCYTAVAARGDEVWILSPVAEAGCQGAVTDLSGVKLRTWYGGSSGDKFLLASDGADVFIAADNGKRQVIRRRNPDGWQTFGEVRKEIVWGDAPRTVDEGGHVNFAQRDWDTFDLTGFAVAGNRLLVASRAEQAVLRFDRESGARLTPIPLPEPGALAGLADGTWFAVSAGSILRFGPGDDKPRVLRQAGTLQPGGLAAAADGRLFVIDRVTHQVAVLDGETGRETGRLGTPGGAYAGKYDPERMVNPMALALADNGWLWVTENRFNPKRVLAWDVQTGKVVKEKFGSTGYGGPGSGFDSEDITRFVGLGCLWKVDLEKKTAVPISVLFRDGADTPKAYHWRFLRWDGRTFLLGYSSCMSLVELLPDGSGKLLARYGNAQGFCFDRGSHVPPVFLDTFYARRGYDTPEKRKRLHGGRLPHSGEFFVWSDASGDGAMQADELEFLPRSDPSYILGSGYWGGDSEAFDIRVPMRTERPPHRGQFVLDLPLQGWHPGGAPRWRTVAKGVKNILTINSNGAWGLEASLVDRHGSLYTNTDPLRSYAPDMTERWSYPNRWNGVHGSHEAPLARPGQLQGTLFFLGNAPLPDDQADVLVMNGNHGRFFTLTSDGFYLDEMFSDVRSGAPLDAYYIGGEAFGGCFGRGNDGHYYLISGHTDYRIFRIDGFDSVRRGPGGKLIVTPEQIEAAGRRTAAGSEQQAKIATIPELASKPSLDGSGAGWPNDPIAAWDKDGKFAVTVQGGFDSENLYLRWSVEDPSPWRNHGKDQTLLFKTGDSVDLQIGVDPGARPHRTKPVPGDLRLLIAPFGDAPIAMLYRHRVPGTSDPTPFSSPWRTEHVDEVRRLDTAKIATSVGRNAAGKPGYVVEAVIPLVELGLAPRAGATYRADFGTLFGDPDGQVTGLRSYWANPNTGLVNDVPGEIMLHPAAWGILSFSRAAAIKSDIRNPKPSLRDLRSKSDIHFAGVVGNSGEDGLSLIRQNPDGGNGENPIGCGVALDRHGTLWTRLAADRVGRLTRDGRQLAQFPVRRSTHKHDALTIVGNHIVLLAAGQLQVLPLDAAPGTAFTSTELQLRAIARTPFEGRLAAITSDSDIIWVDPVGSATEKVCAMPDAWLIETTPEGAILVGTRAPSDKQASLHKIVGKRELTSDAWPRGFGRHVLPPAARASAAFLQADGAGGFFLGGGFLSHLDADLSPAPGTVLGKQNDTVLGGAGDWRPELSPARGVAHCGGDLYAVCGGDGRIFFARWPDPARPMKLVSWITALSECRSLAIDENGDIYADRNVYPWSAGPGDFPDISPSGGQQRSPLLWLRPKQPVSLFSWAHGATQWALRLYSGPGLRQTDWLNEKTLAKEVWWKRANRHETKVWPAVAYPHQDGGFVFLCLADAQGGLAWRLHPNGRFRDVLGPVDFVLDDLKGPGETLTGLMMKNDRTLLAAIDGQIVELVRDGSDWRERTRWQSWGDAPDARFGKSIHIACDGVNLLVADTERHRVLLFPPDGGEPIAQFGVTDRPGNGLDALNSPSLVAINGDQAVVYDAANQRLVKLDLSRAKANP